MRSNCVAVITLSALLTAFGCHKRVPVAATPPTPPPVAVVSALDQANSAFASGSYDEAARGYENYLRATPQGERREQALFQLGLTYALRPAPSVDWQRAAATFKQLIDEYPNGSLKAPTNLILSLHAELDQVAADAKQRDQKNDQKIKQLTTELDRLKKIDADRRKRP